VQLNQIAWLSFWSERRCI